MARVQWRRHDTIVGTPRWGTLFFRGSDGAIMAAAVETSGTIFRSGQAVKAANAYYTAN